MSRIATTPGPLRTWSPSRYSWQKRQSSGSEDPFLRDACGAHADELTDGGVDEPRGVVVAVSATRTVDEHEILASDLCLPACKRCGVGGRAQAGAAVLLHGRRNRVSRRRDGAWPRRVREDVHLRDSRPRYRAECVAKGTLVLGWEADDHIGGQVEVVLERRDTFQILLGGVAPR